MNDHPILGVKNLKKHFIVGRTARHVVKAVDGVTLDICRGETFGLVGESGCGKSTLGRLMLNLIAPTGGTVQFNGKDIAEKNKSEMKSLRKKLQIIFQDPYASLNPRKNVAHIIGSGLEIHRIGTRTQRRERIAHLMEQVGLRSEHILRYPHEFSGGQRQRICIARALATAPEVIIADEPVSALDVSIQAQIINLLARLQDELGLTYVFISHDLSVVRHMCNRIAVMYLGRIVELCTRDELFDRQFHPYTKALVSAVPQARIDRKTERIVLKGDVPSPVNMPPGCAFHKRCTRMQEICTQETPELTEINGRQVACHFPMNN